MNELTLVKLNTLCTKITDGSHYSPTGTETGFPMLSVKDMRDNAFDYSDCKFILKEDYLALVKGDCKPLKNDVVIAKDGSYLKHVFVIKSEIDQAVLSSIGILRPNVKKINPDYLKYYLQTKSVKATVSKKYVSGSALPRIILKNFGEIEVIYKSLDSQKQIAKVLSDLDAKIEVNNKINQELEAMAKTIYDYWFVQFDFPFDFLRDGEAGAQGKPSLNGKPYKSSGGKMVYNEELKREIPEGWEVKSLVDIENNIITGKTPSTLIKENFGDEIKFITIDDIRRNRFVINTERSLSKLGADTQINKYLYPNDICVSCIGTVGVVGFVSSKSQSNQQINSISTPRYYNRYYLYHYLKDFFEYNVGAKKGAVLSNMNKGEFESITVLNPSTSIKKKYFKIVHSFYEQQHKLIKQNQKLAELRDWLLPMLMNGQVTVGDTEQELGMVAEDNSKYKIN